MLVSATVSSMKNYSQYPSWRATLQRWRFIGNKICRAVHHTKLKRILS